MSTDFSESVGRSRDDRSFLVARAERLRQILADNAQQGAADRRVTESSIAALAEAGLFKVMLPRRYGGYEAGVRTSLDVMAAVAYGDGAAGWVVSLVNHSAWDIGLCPTRVQDEVFGADPDTRVCGSLAPVGTAVAVEGGVRLSGRWGYVSGSLHAQWAMLGFNLVDETGAVIEGAVAPVPAADYTVSDTWFTAGMRGSGSNTLSAEDVFVPWHRVVLRARLDAGDYPTEHKDEITYRSGFYPTHTMGLIGPLLGLGRAALDHVLDAAGTKRVAGTVFRRQADSAGLQMLLGDAALLIDTAHLHAYRAADDLDDHAARGEQPSFPTRARVRADASRAAGQVVDAITILLDVHGSGGFVDSSPLQRIWQDANVAARHVSLLPGISSEVYGKALLGLPNDVVLSL
ncbi:acyl-CoA dehydrogenase family protein [Pseudonocardia alaniniphila]|uniref:Acyl-CoA dehydrogenase family protein n=1 Tax=Pseudonocardia alaniniphila TaxID=75291 RepID=A0ABS9TRP8_9PSEU|nr:acyl-CoA dehydrogenase family protein [Pseudonocardia alaniniphila]MCH6171227.1 acyl-CoA dehydrogenase family protein [Pseudonocardia alaniniphila]